MLCAVCHERPSIGIWHGPEQDIYACRGCMRQLVLVEAERPKPADPAPLTDAEVARLLFAKYLMTEGVITEECPEYIAAEL